MAQMTYICAMNKEDFGAMLRKAREWSGIGVNEASRDLGISDTQIRQMEFGRANQGLRTLGPYLRYIGFKIIVANDMNDFCFEINSLGSFCEAMKHIRNHYGLSQYKFADKIGVTRGSVISVENGGGCTMLYLFKISNAFDDITVTLEK